MRRQQGISQERLALRADLTIASLARIELGRSDPSWSTVCAIAAALHITLADLARAVETEERGYG